MPLSKAVSFFDHAEELLSKFPSVDRSELLTTLTALYLMDFKYGNKRAERAACDFLNLLQTESIKQIQEQHKAAAKVTPCVTCT